jgi:hypothetical protein
MSKVLLTVEAIFTALIPELAFLQEVKFPKRPKKADCIHPRNDAGKYLARSGSYRVFRDLLSGYNPVTTTVEFDDGTKERVSGKDPSCGFSGTTFAASVGCMLGVSTAIEAKLFYAMLVLLGLDSHPSTFQGTIQGNAKKWTRPGALQNPSYSADFALLDKIPEELMSYIKECWKRLTEAYSAEVQRQADEIRKERVA